MAGLKPLQISSFTHGGVSRPGVDVVITPHRACLEMAAMKFAQMTKPAALRAPIWGALALTALLVAGCDQPAPVGSSTRLYAIDQTGGAKVCNAPTAKPPAGATTD